MAFSWPFDFFRKLWRKFKLRGKRKEVKVKRYVRIRKRKRKMEEKRESLVSDVMTRAIISVSASASMEKVAQIFLINKISGAPVLDGEFFVGEISKTDLLNLVKKERLEDLTEEDNAVLRKNKVSEFMKKPICIHFDQDMKTAKKKMEEYNIKRLLVLDKRNQLIGIITRTDLLKGVTKEEIKEDISTKIDEILRILEEGPTDFSKLSKSMKIPENVVENWAKILEEHDLVEISYPPIGSPVLTLKRAKASS